MVLETHANIAHVLDRKNRRSERLSSAKRNTELAAEGDRWQSTTRGPGGETWAAQPFAALRQRGRRETTGLSGLIRRWPSLPPRAGSTRDRKRPASFEATYGPHLLARSRPCGLRFPPRSHARPSLCTGPTRNTAPPGMPKPAHSPRRQLAWRVGPYTLGTHRRDQLFWRSKDEAA